MENTLIRRFWSDRNRADSGRHQDELTTCACTFPQRLRTQYVLVVLFTSAIVYPRNFFNYGNRSLRVCALELNARHAAQFAQAPSKPDHWLSSSSSPSRFDVFSSHSSTSTWHNDGWVGGEGNEAVNNNDSRCAPDRISYFVPLVRVVVRGKSQSEKE